MNRIWQNTPTKTAPNATDFETLKKEVGAIYGSTDELEKAIALYSYDSHRQKAESKLLSAENNFVLAAFAAVNGVKMDADEGPLATNHIAYREALLEARFIQFHPAEAIIKGIEKAVRDKFKPNQPTKEKTR